MIDTGANKETAVIATVGTAGVSGTGITLAAPLALAHAAGAQVTGGVPTPGAANRYYRRRPYACGKILKEPDTWSIIPTACLATH